MQLVATTTPTAKTVGQNIVIDLGDGVTIQLTPHQTLSLVHAAKWEATMALENARFIEPVGAQVIAFPIHATRRV